MDSHVLWANMMAEGVFHLWKPGTKLHVLVLVLAQARVYTVVKFEGFVIDKFTATDNILVGVGIADRRDIMVPFIIEVDIVEIVAGKRVIVAWIGVARDRDWMVVKNKYLGTIGVDIVKIELIIKEFNPLKDSNQVVSR